MKEAHATEIGTPVVPVMRYRDLPAAIDWLCRAFGFETYSVTADKDGTIAFAHLTFGSAMVMVGPVRKTAFDNYLRQPDEIGGAETQVCYFFVADVQAHCARATAAGARIVFDIQDWANGGRSYSCRDPEGHLWNFGDYNPWPPRAAREPEHPPRQRSVGGAAWPPALAAGFLVGAAAVVVGAGSVPDAVMNMVRESVPASTAVPDATSTATPLARLDPERIVAEAAACTPDDGREELQLAHRGKDAAERAAAEAREELAKARDAKRTVEAVAGELHRQLMEVREDKEAAEQAARSAHDRLRAARIGRSIAERAAQRARRQLAEERRAASQSIFSFGGQAQPRGGE